MLKERKVMTTTQTSRTRIVTFIVCLFAVCMSLSLCAKDNNKTQSEHYAVDSDRDGLENKLEVTLGSDINAVDTDEDGLSDYDEYCKYRTDPTKKDSDGDGTPDGDWQERREYTYTIRALCEIRPPSGMEMINDLYQDARPTGKKASLEDARVMEVLIFPYASAHVYPQPYPKQTLDKSLHEYILPTVSMNYSPEMKEQISEIVKGATTDIEAIEKILQWTNSETELIIENPHWSFFNVTDGKLIWHKSFGDTQQDALFLETQFFGDSMFKRKVHGTCTSTAILRGTMFRAAGIPSRLIQTLPLITRYTGDPEPLAERLRDRTMSKGYDWGPGSGGANHAYNEVFLNNRWVRVDNSVGTGPFAGGKLFVKAWSSASWNNLREEWNNKRCVRALDVSDAYATYESPFAKADIAVGDENLEVTIQPDGRFKARIRIDNEGSAKTPEFGVYFYAGDPDKDGRHLKTHYAGPIRPGEHWAEYNPRLELKPGEDTIFVIVDPDNKVAESDEMNNKASKKIPGKQSDKPIASEKPKPDLAVTTDATKRNVSITSLKLCSSHFNMYMLFPSGVGVDIRNDLLGFQGIAPNISSAPHTTEYYNKFFIERIYNNKYDDVAVLLFSLDTEERIPPEYEDILPRPWSEIEAQLKEGKTQELTGMARDFEVIVLAAPTKSQLVSLMQKSKLLHDLKIRYGSK